MKNHIVRRAARMSVLSLVTAALAVGSATGALATDNREKGDESTGPQIVSPSEYAGEGGTDPQSMAPIDEVAPAQGASVQKLTDLLTETTGLELFQAPGVEKYEELGQTLTFSLGDGNYAHPLNITRPTVHNDVPSSVLSSDGDETSTTTLPDGSQLLTAVGADGIRVSTLSKDGQLTLWETPATTEQNVYSAETLARWARTVDEQGITAVWVVLLAVSRCPCLTPPQEGLSELCGEWLDEWALFEPQPTTVSHDGGRADRPRTRVPRDTLTGLSHAALPSTRASRAGGSVAVRPWMMTPSSRIVGGLVIEVCWAGHLASGGDASWLRSPRRRSPAPRSPPAPPRAPAPAACRE